MLDEFDITVNSSRVMTRLTDKVKEQSVLPESDTHVYVLSRYGSRDLRGQSTGMVVRVVSRLVWERRKDRNMNVQVVNEIETNLNLMTDFKTN